MNKLYAFLLTLRLEDISFMQEGRKEANHTWHHNIGRVEWSLQEENVRNEVSSVMTRTEALDTRVNGLETELREVRNEINLKFEALMSQMAEQFSSIGQRLDNQQPTGLSTPITASSNKGKGPILVSGHQEARRNLSEELRLEEERGPMMVKKVEFPDFDGDDVLTWVTKAEQYFAIQATKPGDRVTVAIESWKWNFQISNRGSRGASH
ncbi:hypothetical protein V2J09_020271 [Rumex salicifolius]